MIYFIFSFHQISFFLEVSLIIVDKSSESWFNGGQPAGGVARCSTYLFPMRSPGSHPPFRGFPLYAQPLPHLIRMETTALFPSALHKD